MVGASGAYADISTTGASGQILFTQAWPQENQPDRWLGKNIEIEIVP